MLNTNEAKRKQYAQKEYNLKLRMERLLVPSLLVFFRQYGEDFEKRYAALGILPDNDLFQGKMKSLLQTHYDKVADVFSQRIVKEIGKPDNHEDVLTSINQKNQLHHELTANDSSKIIADTTQKNAHSSIKKVIEGATATGIVLNRAQIAKKARFDLLRTNTNRVPGIAITETQASSEHAKQAEFNYLNFHNATIDGVNIADKKKQKMWFTIMDGKERPAHHAAFGQIVNFDALYTVGGEKLMYPRDTTNGATVGNIVNCRCGSVPIIR